MCILISQRPPNHSVCLPKASNCSVVNFAYVHAHACTRRALHMHRAAERRWLQLIAAGRPPGKKKKKGFRVCFFVFLFGGEGRGLSFFVFARLPLRRPAEKRGTPGGIIFVSSSSSAYLACLCSGKKGGSLHQRSNSVCFFSSRLYSFRVRSEQKAAVGLHFQMFQVSMKGWRRLGGQKTNA